MQTQFRRQPWGFDANYQRVEALDDQGRPLGYVFFVPRRNQEQWRQRSEQQAAWTFPAYARQWLVSLLSAAT